MIRQRHKVEQVTSDAKVVIDCDQPLSREDQSHLLSNFFSRVTSVNGGFTISHMDRMYTILTKNVTYLGAPWGVFKKRIQVPGEWNERLSQNDTVLMGIYHYMDTVLFVFFDKKSRGKNSAAHVSTIDLLKAVQLGHFEKIDARQNRVICCRPDHFLDVFDRVVSHTQVAHSKEIELFSHFLTTLPATWDGCSAYDEMRSARFSQWKQSEWPGFYAEFQFERFLNSLPPEERSICSYVRNKRVGEFDLDLEFKRAGFLGDLKTHSVNSQGIPGNDKKTFMSALDVYGTLWYIVLDLEYQMDKDHECVVSTFWNTAINLDEKSTRKALDSYSKKMKHSGKLCSLKILEFNRFNKQYISDFKQGKQPDGSERNVKIMIDKKNIDNFVIFRENKSEPMRY